MRSTRAPRARHAYVALVLLLASVSVLEAATATWNANNEQDLAGYVLHWGMTSGVYTNSIDVGNSTSWTLTLTPGQYYFVVRAYNTAGLYSGYSTEVPYTESANNSAATLISPSGTITTRTPQYRWNAVSNSTWYLLRVDDSSGNQINQWYTAAQLGCSGGTGTCSITPAVQLADGAAQAFVQTYGDSFGYGPWSSARFFTVAVAGGGGGPGTVTMTNPSGTVSTRQPTYTWTADRNSTWYLLWVADSAGVRINQWYTASQVGCSSGTGTCTITPGEQLGDGAAQARVQTWGDAGGYGPWSSTHSFTVAVAGPGAPGTVTVTTPSGTVFTRQPTYTWTAKQGSTWYLLWVEDSTGVRINQWYTASQVGCSGGTGTCSVTPGVSLANGAAQAWVQPYDDAAGYGTWSNGRSFVVAQ